MDPDIARKLFNEGAFLILLDVPKGTEFGIDWNSWVTGPKFKGVKMIPPGFHFIFYSSTSKHGGHSSPRTGFFHIFKSREILFTQWDASLEEVKIVQKSSEEIDNVRKDLQNLDKNLAPYPYEGLQKWVSLTDLMTEDVLQKLQPDSGKILSVPELIPVPDDEEILEDSKTTGENSQKSARKLKHGKVDEEGLPVLKPRAGTEIKFTNIPKIWYPPGSSPREISRHSVDSSYVLDQLVKKCEKPEDLLAEIQFAFVCFVLGQVFDAFEQWKKLVHVLCSCEEFLKSHQEMYKALLTIFYHQLNEIPRDFFVDVVSSNNFLVTTLSTLFSNLESEGIDSDLRKRAKQFRKYLTKKFKWDFKSEPEDWAPVVIDTE